MAGESPRGLGIPRFASLACLLEWALGVRVLAALLVGWASLRRGSLCIFPDTLGYWILGVRFATARPTRSSSGGISPTSPRGLRDTRSFLRDAVSSSATVRRPCESSRRGWGRWSVWLVARLTARMVPKTAQPTWRGWTIPLVAAALAAFEPYVVVTSALILTEAVFIPLMLASLWGMSALWPSGEVSGPNGRSRWWCALGTGLASGAAILVRPSWARIPAGDAVGVDPRERSRSRSRTTVGGDPLGGRRDAGRPRRDDPVVDPQRPSLRPVRPHGDLVRRQPLRRAEPQGHRRQRHGVPCRTRRVAARRTGAGRAAARPCRGVCPAQPGRAVRLAAIKLAVLGPWPNADSFRSPAINTFSRGVHAPALRPAGHGVVGSSARCSALVLLAGPLFYFCALHMVFASSMRYRIPAIVPAFGLAGIGLMTLVRRSRNDE